MARRPVADQAATRWITLRVTAATHAALAELARLNRTSRSGVVRDAVEAYAADCSERRVFAAAADGVRRLRALKLYEAAPQDPKRAT
jgi:predicted transcriptional regulator